MSPFFSNGLSSILERAVFPRESCKQSIAFNIYNMSVIYLISTESGRSWIVARFDTKCFRNDNYLRFP